MSTQNSTHGELGIDTHSHLPPSNWPDFSRKFGVSGFPVIERVDGRTIMREGKFFREVWSNIHEIHVQVAQYAEYGEDAFL